MTGVFSPAPALRLFIIIVTLILLSAYLSSSLLILISTLFLILYFYLFHKLPFIVIGFLSVLLFFKSQPLTREKAESLQSENPVIICLVKKHTDWKNNVWWEGEVRYEKYRLPAILYPDSDDYLTSGMVCHIHNPRISIRNMGHSQRISISVNQHSSIIPEKKNTSVTLENTFEKIREDIRLILMNNSDLRSSFIAFGLFLGEKQMIPEPIKNRINRTGISHLFAVSGLHVGFLVLLLSVVLKQVGFGPVFQAVFICVFAFFYAFLTPFSSSVFRTVMMLLIFSMCRLMKRKIHILQVVFLSAVVMLILDPSHISQVGFWFSYLAVVGILVMYPVISKKVRYQNKMIKYILDVILVSFSATWGILPAGVIVFGTFSSLAILLNIVMIPLVFLMLASIIAKLFLSFLPLIGGLICSFYDILCRIFFGILDIMNPCADYLVYHVRNIPIVLSVWTIGTLFIYSIPRKTVHKFWLCIFLISCAWLLPIQNPPSVIISDTDNSLCFKKGKNVLMINGTGVEFFENRILKKFRYSGLKPDLLVVTDELHADTRQILLLKKRYPRIKIISSGTFNKLADITLLKDTTFQYGNNTFYIYPKNEKLNVHVFSSEYNLGIMEFAEKMEKPDIILSRKKYSEMRTGTDKFLVVREHEEKEELREALKDLDLEDGIAVW